MKTLPTPYASYRRDLRSALTPGEQQRWGGEINAACQQAQRYARRSPKLGKLICVFNSAQARAFFGDLYESNRKAVTAICERVRAKLDAHARAHCQYCGLARPRSLDHYLERARFPELSIYVRNLVPCCDECNNTKHTRTFDANGERQILHFYDDDVNALPDLIVVTFVFVVGVPVAQFAVHPSTIPLNELYRRHFYALKLDVRYAEEAASLLRVVRRRAMEEQLSVPAVVASLQSQANALQRELGRNQFEVALYEAAAADTRVLQWMTQP